MQDGFDAPNTSVSWQSTGLQKIIRLQGLLKSSVSDDT